jgi:ADP-ribose pyrophosphatase YjhB (NUDIX family)
VVESLFLTSSVKIFEQQKRTHYAFLPPRDPGGGPGCQNATWALPGAFSQAKNTLAFNCQRPQKEAGLTTLLGKKLGGFSYGLCNNEI